MEKSDIGNRMALGITTILTIMFLLGSLNGNLPKVSYPKALDWYLLVSFSFVFLSLIECLVVYVLLKQTRKHDQDITREVRINCCYSIFCNIALCFVGIYDSVSDSQKRKHHKAKVVVVVNVDLEPFVQVEGGDQLHSKTISVKSN